MHRILQNNKFIRILSWSLFYIYLLLLVKVILFKYPLAMMIREIKQSSLEGLQSRLILNSNFIPFKTILYYLNGGPNLNVSFINLIANLIAFTPLGFMLPFLNQNKTRIKRCIAVSFAISLAFEIIQLLTGTGSFDIDDLILNTLGAIIGFVLYTTSSIILSKRTSQKLGE